MTKLIHTKYKTIQPHTYKVQNNTTSQDDKIDTYKVQNNTTSLRWQNWYIQSTKQYNLTRWLIHTKYKTIQPHYDIQSTKQYNLTKMTKLIHTKYKTIQPHWDDKIDTYKVQNNTTSLRWQNWYIQSTKQYNLTEMTKLIHTKYKTIQPH